MGEYWSGECGGVLKGRGWGSTGGERMGEYWRGEGGKYWGGDWGSTERERRGEYWMGEGGGVLKGREWEIIEGERVSTEGENVGEYWRGDDGEVLEKRGRGSKTPSEKYATDCNDGMADDSEWTAPKGRGLWIIDILSPSDKSSVTRQRLGCHRRASRRHGCEHLFSDHWVSRPGRNRRVWRFFFLPRANSFDVTPRFGWNFASATFPALNANNACLGSDSFPPPHPPSSTPWVLHCRLHSDFRGSILRTNRSCRCCHAVVPAWLRVLLLLTGLWWCCWWVWCYWLGCGCWCC